MMTMTRYLNMQHHFAQFITMASSATQGGATDKAGAETVQCEVMVGLMPERRRKEDDRGQQILGLNYQVIVPAPLMSRSQAEYTPSKDTIIRVRGKDLTILGLAIEGESDLIWVIRAGVEL